MAHPIHQANEGNPFGEFTREEFYKKHQIIHHQSFMLNKKRMKIFTQSWRQDSSFNPKGLVAMVHGYSSESSWLNELTAVAIAEAGFLVIALDLQGHGCSDGPPGHIPNINYVIKDCIQFFDSVKKDYPNLPAYLYGESLGGAICILICLKQKYSWNGLILNGAMCGISSKFSPIWLLKKLLPIAAFFAPTWQVVVSKPVASKFYKEGRKRNLAAKSPSRRRSGKPPAATALEFRRVCEHIRRHCDELEVPLLMVHGEDDTVCEANAAKFVYESAAAKDKTLKVFPGMWHMLIGEPNENVEIVFGAILSWLADHSDKVKTMGY